MSPARQARRCTVIWSGDRDTQAVQKMSFAPNCRMRALWAPVTCRKPVVGSRLNVLLLSPKLFAADPEFPAIGSHWVWLKTLKASARNSNATRSVMAKCLNSDISQLVQAGLVRLLRPESPNVRARGVA